MIISHHLLQDQVFFPFPSWGTSDSSHTLAYHDHVPDPDPVLDPPVAGDEILSTASPSVLLLESYCRYIFPPICHFSPFLKESYLSTSLPLSPTLQSVFSRPDHRGRTRNLVKICFFPP